MGKLFWILKQLLPLQYNSTFKEEGVKKISIWNMWFGRSFNIKTFVVPIQQMSDIYLTELIPENTWVVEKNAPNSGDVLFETRSKQLALEFMAFLSN